MQKFKHGEKFLVHDKIKTLENVSAIHFEKLKQGRSQQI